MDGSAVFEVIHYFLVGNLPAGSQAHNKQGVLSLGEDSLLCVVCVGVKTYPNQPVEL